MTITNMTLYTFLLKLYLKKGIIKIFFIVEFFCVISLFLMPNKYGYYLHYFLFLISIILLTINNSTINYRMYKSFFLVLGITKNNFYIKKSFLTFSLFMFTILVSIVSLCLKFYIYDSF